MELARLAEALQRLAGMCPFDVDDELKHLRITRRKDLVAIYAWHR